MERHLMHIWTYRSKARHEMPAVHGCGASALLLHAACTSAENLRVCRVCCQSQQMREGSSRHRRGGEHRYLDIWLRLKEVSGARGAGGGGGSGTARRGALGALAVTDAPAAALHADACENARENDGARGGEARYDEHWHEPLARAGMRIERVFAGTGVGSVVVFVGVAPGCGIVAAISAGLVRPRPVDVGWVGLGHHERHHSGARATICAVGAVVAVTIRMPRASVVAQAVTGPLRVAGAGEVAAADSDRAVVAAADSDRAVVAAADSDRAVVAAADSDRAVVAAACANWAATQLFQRLRRPGRRSQRSPFRRRSPNSRSLTHRHHSIRRSRRRVHRRTGCCIGLWFWAAATAPVAAAAAAVTAARARGQRCAGAGHCDGDDCRFRLRRRPEGADTNDVARLRHLVRLADAKGLLDNGASVGAAVVEAKPVHRHLVLVERRQVHVVAGGLAVGDPHLRLRLLGVALLAVEDQSRPWPVDLGQHVQRAEQVLPAVGDAHHVEAGEPAGHVAVGRVVAFPVAAGAHDGRIVAVAVARGGGMGKAEVVPQLVHARGGEAVLDQGEARAGPLSLEGPRAAYVGEARECARAKVGRQKILDVCVAARVDALLARPGVGQLHRLVKGASGAPRWNCGAHGDSGPLVVGDADAAGGAPHAIFDAPLGAIRRLGVGVLESDHQNVVHVGSGQLASDVLGGGVVCGVVELAVHCGCGAVVPQQRTSTGGRRRSLRRADRADKVDGLAVGDPARKQLLLGLAVVLPGEPDGRLPRGGGSAEGEGRGHA
eukprot:scaffold10054_cov133-Isochrysis_galbana.AAC.4